MGEESLVGARPLERFQFERIGFFTKDSRYDMTFLRIVPLKESGLKKTESVEASKRSRKDEQAQQMARKQARMNLDPREMFKVDEEYAGKFTAYDKDGVPTHDH